MTEKEESRRRERNTREGWGPGGQEGRQHTKELPKCGEASAEGQEGCQTAVDC